MSKAILKSADAAAEKIAAVSGGFIGQYIGCVVESNISVSYEWFAKKVQEHGLNPDLVPEPPSGRAVYGRIIDRWTRKLQTAKNAKKYGFKGLKVTRTDEGNSQGDGFVVHKIQPVKITDKKSDAELSGDAALDDYIACLGYLDKHPGYGNGPGVGYVKTRLNEANAGGPPLTEAEAAGIKIAQQIVSEFQAEYGVLTAKDIRAFAKAWLISKDRVAMVPGGHWYFIPAHAIDSAQRMTRLFRDLAFHTGQWPDANTDCPVCWFGGSRVPSAEQDIQPVRRAATQSFETQIKDLVEECEAWAGKSVRESTVAKTMEQAEQLGHRIRMYASLAGEIQGGLMERLEEIKKRAAEVAGW